MTDPALSVIMAVHNGQPFVRDAVQSILDQSYTNFEFIIVDDASSDGTLEILIDFAERDARVKVLQNPQNLGQTRSLNRGFADSRGDSIARQDADDLSLPQRLEKQIAFLQENPEIGLVGTGYDVIDENGVKKFSIVHPAHDSEIRWRMLFYNAFCHTSVVFRRNLVADLKGPFNEEIPFSQDYELWGRLLKKSKGANLAEPLVALRAHSLSLGRQNEAKRFESGNIIVGRHMADMRSGENPSTELISKLREWYHAIPAKIGREDLPACGLLFQLLEKFEKSFSGDPRFLRDLRLYWVGNLLVAAPVGLWGYLLRFKPVRTALLKDGFKMGGKGLNRLMRFFSAETPQGK